MVSGETNWNPFGSLHDMKEYWMTNDGLDIRGPSRMNPVGSPLDFQRLRNGHFSLQLNIA
jgi:hypothetical protein